MRLACVIADLLSGQFAPDGYSFANTKDNLLNEEVLGSPFTHDVRDFFEGKGAGAFVASSDLVRILDLPTQSCQELIAAIWACLPAWNKISGSVGSA